MVVKACIRVACTPAVAVETCTHMVVFLEVLVDHKHKVLVVVIHGAWAAKMVNATEGNAGLTSQGKAREREGMERVQEEAIPNDPCLACRVSKRRDHLRPLNVGEQRLLVHLWCQV